MKKRLIMILTVMIAVLALSAGTMAADEDSSAVTLTLKQAVEKGLKDNRQIYLAGLAVESAEINVKQTKGSAEQYKDSGMSRNTEMAYEAITLYPQSAQLNLDLAKLQLNYTVNSVKCGIEKAYNGLQLAEKNLEVLRLSQNNAKTLYDNTVSKQKLGVASKMDVMNAESAYLNAQATYQNGRTSVLSARMALNSLLNQAVETRIIIKDKQSFKAAEGLSLQKSLEEALKTDLAYNQAKTAEAIGALTFTKVKDFNAENTYAYKQGVIAYEQQKQALRSAADSLESAVRLAYENLAVAEANYRTYAASRDLAKEAYRLTRLRYDNGMATIYDVQNAEAAYLQAETGLMNAINNYNQAKNAISYGVYQ
ncbi:MAG: TolC family protein [Clostridia bacterium]|nr:TolC family protein [Clostridia bacterium]